MSCSNCKGILFILLSSFTGSTFSQDYNFRNFSSEDGLAQTYIYSIIQDSYGYLWIGTGDGLSKYNGFVFENYKTADSLADNLISGSIADGDCLWFGDINGRISSFKGKSFHTIAIPEPFKSPITDFVKSPDDRIWASSFSDGFLKLSRDSGVVKQCPFRDHSITTFEFLDGSDLLVGTNSGLLYCRLNPSGEIEIAGSVADVPESRVMCIQKMRNNSGFYVATENDGLFRVTYENSQLKVTKLVPDQNLEFTGVQNIFEDSQSNIWLCSFGEGLIKMAATGPDKLSVVKHFNKASGFVSDNVKTVFEDLEGNIWSGNYGEGLTLVTPKTFSVRHFDKQSYGAEIFSIYSDPQYIWLGTENGLLKTDRQTGEIIKFYGKESGLPKDTVKTIFSSDGKELWIGTEKHGLFRIEAGKDLIYRFPIKNGTLENSISAITGKGDQVWAGTKKGLFCINTDSDKFIEYSINQGGLPHNFINCLHLDGTGRLWVGTSSSSLAYIKDGKVYRVLFNAGAGILAITEDRDSRIWVGSNGRGVFRIESDSIVNITAKEGLLSSYCYSLICDNNNNIWVGHKGGLSRIRISDFSVKPIQQIEGLHDNYQFNPNAICKDQRGTIWFGSSNGMVSYETSMEYPRLQPPVLGITSLKINDERKEYTEKIALSPGRYKIRIGYLGVSLKEPSLVTYSYIMEGYDQWHLTTKDTSITYNNLTEGDYEFILIASSGDGAITESPLIISIVIRKPIWKKLWFYLLTASILIGMAFIYIKRREHKFLVENRILEEKVRERTYEIQCQKNEIEQQRDIIDEKNTNITASIMYASNIQNSVLPPIDVFYRLFPDSFLFSRPKDIISGDFYWVAEKDDKIVFVVADCTGHGVPGAFMSLLGISLLNEIVNIQGITRSDDIVSKLRGRVIDILHHGKPDVNTSDGMDIALCVLDKRQNKIQYSGGMNNLVYIRDGRLNVVKADRFSVCYLNGHTNPFKMNEIDIRKGDMYYLFSDGYQDQFGGEYDKKYLVVNFYLTLLEIHKLPVADQTEMLELRLKEWMKDSTQTDDITVMGIRM